MHAHRRGAQLLEQRAIVRHQQPDAAEAAQRRRDLLAPLSIQVVRRLVERQHVRLGGQRRRQLPPLALAQGERSPALQLRRRAAQPAAPAPGLAVVGGGERAERVLQLDHLLPAQDHAPIVRIADDRAARRGECAERQLQERGLAGAVVADHAGPARGEVQLELGQDRRLPLVREPYGRKTNRWHTASRGRRRKDAPLAWGEIEEDARLALRRVARGERTTR
jgi:hypothetical protein